jgi:hypothetical protein
MKQNVLKSLIKQAVKEAIQEELKDILLEAVRTPKQVVVENTQPQTIKSSATDIKEKRAAYQNILGDMSAQFTSQDVPKPFNPQGGAPGMDLPAGEVNMDQIMGLMSNK